MQGTIYNYWPHPPQQLCGGGASEALTQYLMLSELLAEVFSAPLSVADLGQLGQPINLEFLQQVANQLQTKPAAASLIALLGDYCRRPTLSADLQRQYTALFEGVFRHRSVSPYAGYWLGGSVAALAQADAFLQQLDLRQHEQYPERVDHVSVQLAALCIALDDQQWPIAKQLAQYLQKWLLHLSRPYSNKMSLVFMLLGVSY